MKGLAAILALSTLAAATVGLAQQATQQTPTQPPASTSQAASPSDPGTGNAEQQALMKHCVAQVQAANPKVSMKDIQTYCEDEVKRVYTSKPD